VIAAATMSMSNDVKLPQHQQQQRQQQPARRCTEAEITGPETTGANVRSAVVGQIVSLTLMDSLLSIGSYWLLCRSRIASKRRLFQ